MYFAIRKLVILQTASHNPYNMYIAFAKIQESQKCFMPPNI